MEIDFPYLSPETLPMKKYKNPLLFRMRLIAVVLFSFIANIALGQTLTSARINLEGTSNIHDWVMKSDKASGNATIAFGPNNAITSLSNLNFTLQVESLKSEHKAMDKNTYKAMNTEKYPSLNFAAQTSSVKSLGNNNFQIIGHGKLTINGTTKPAEITANCVVNADKSVTCTGSYKFKMTQFSVEPPSIMFGTITVGDDLNVKFQVTYK